MSDQKIIRIVGMSDDEIVHIFETKNISLSDLSLKTGRSVKDLRRLLREKLD